MHTLGERHAPYINARARHTLSGRCVFVWSDQEQFETLDGQREMTDVTMLKHVRTSQREREKVL